MKTLDEKIAYYKGLMSKDALIEQLIQELYGETEDMLINMIARKTEDAINNPVSRQLISYINAALQIKERNKAEENAQESRKRAKRYMWISLIGAAISAAPTIWSIITIYD